MGELNIELVSEADIPAMLAFWRNTPGLGVGDEEASLRDFIRRNPTTCLLVKSGDSIVSTVMGGFDGRRGYIYHLAVHPDYQRRGWGTKMLQEVIIRLEELKAEKIHLFVFKDNQVAQAFYESQAWVKRHDIQVYSLNTKK